METVVSKPTACLTEQSSDTRNNATGSFCAESIWIHVRYGQNATYSCMFPVQPDLKLLLKKAQKGWDANNASPTQQQSANEVIIEKF